MLFQTTKLDPDEKFTSNEEESLITQLEPEDHYILCIM